MSTILLTYRADLSALKQQLAQIPGITKEEARRMVSDLDKAFRRAEAAAKKAAKASQATWSAAAKAADGAAKSTTGVSRSINAVAMQLPDVASQLAAGASPFTVLTQQGLQVVQQVGFVGGALRGLASFLTGPWGLAAATAIAAVSGFVGVFQDIRIEADRLKRGVGQAVASIGDAAEEAVRQADAALKDFRRRVEEAERDATLQEAVAKGIFTEEEARALKEGMAVREAIQGAIDHEVQRIAALDDQRRQILDELSHFDRLTPSQVEDLGKQLEENKRQREEAQRQIEALNRKMDEAAALQDRMAEAERKEAEARRQQRKEIKQQAEALAENTLEWGTNLEKLREAKIAVEKMVQKTINPQDPLVAQREELLARVAEIEQRGADEGVDLEDWAAHQRLLINQWYESELDKLRKERLAKEAKATAQQQAEILDGVASLVSVASDGATQVYEAHAQRVEDLQDSIDRARELGLDAQAEALQQQLDAEKDAARKAWAVQKALALAEITARTAVGVVKAIAAENYIQAAVMAASGTIQAATVMSIPPPAHRGLAPDEEVRTVRRDEAVLTPAALRALGLGPREIRAANAGIAPGGGVAQVVVEVGGRVADIQVADALRRRSALRYRGLRR